MTEPIVHLDVAAAYDRWSRLYDTYDNPMVFAAARIVATGLGDVVGADVVEFGCGTGRNLAAAIAGGARSTVGLDMSEGMLAKARERLAGTRLLVHDMGRPAPLPDRSTDLVLFCLTLEHVARIGLPIGEARRILRPGGRLVIVEIHPFLSLGGVAAHFKDGGEEVRMPVHPHRFCDFINAIAAAGLALRACREWTPADLGDGLPEKVLRRGPDAPLVVEFQAVAP